MSRSVGQLKIVLTGENAQLKNTLKGSQSHVKETADVFKAHASQIHIAMNGAAESFRGFALKVAGVGVAFEAIKGSWDRFAEGFAAANEAEKAERKMEILTGSAIKAKEILEDIKGFAGTQTAFGLGDLEKASIRLTGIGVAAEQLIPTIRTLGDLSLGETEAFDTMLEAYTKGFAAKTLDARELTSFTRAGIPIYEELAKMAGTTADKIKGLAKEGGIGFGDFQVALNNLTGESGRFEDALSRMADTTDGKLAKMHRSVAGVFKDFAIGVKESFDVKGMLDGTISFITSIRQNVVPALVEAFAGAARLTMRAWEGVRAFWKEFGNDLTRIFGSVVGAIKAAVVSAGQFIASTIAGADKALGGTREWAETLHQAFTNIAHAFDNLPDYFELALVKMEKALRSYVENFLKYTLAAVNSFLDPIIAWMDGGQNYEAAKAAAENIKRKQNGQEPLVRGIPDRGPVLDRREDEIKERINANNAANDKAFSQKVTTNNYAAAFKDAGEKVYGGIVKAAEFVAKPDGMSDAKRDATVQEINRLAEIVNGYEQAINAVRYKPGHGDEVKGMIADKAILENKIKRLAEDLDKGIGPNNLVAFAGAIAGVMRGQKAQLAPENNADPEDNKDKHEKLGNPAAEFGSVAAYKTNVASDQLQQLGVLQRVEKNGQEANRQLKRCADALVNKHTNVINV